jgi:hypothetical protein
MSAAKTMATAARGEAIAIKIRVAGAYRELTAITTTGIVTKVINAAAITNRKRAGTTKEEQATIILNNPGKSLSN